MFVFKHDNVSWTNDPGSTVEYTVHQDVNLAELMQEFRRFLLAAGFHPDSIDDYISGE